MGSTFIRKISALTVAMCLTFFASRAQLTVVDTGDCNGHVLNATVIGTLPTGAGITSDDGYSGVMPIGFTFNFYGTNYTQLVIGSNGVLNFDLTLAGAYCPWPITAALLGNPSMRNAICGPWCDIYIPAGGTITRSTSGTAPNRKFSVTWCGTRMYSCTAEWVTSQVILYETSNLIEVHTAHKTVCAWNNGRAITGIQNAAGTLATVAPGRDWTPTWSVITPPEAWRFTPSGGTYTVASIPYAPLPFATGTTYWYNTATGAYLGSGPYLPVNPPVSTTYTAAVLGCNDTTRAYITVGPCRNACVGDTLVLNRPGDSTGATYMWYGPAPSTTVFATTQQAVIFPTTAAHNGTFSCVRTIGGVSDTIEITINVRHKPNVTASSNAPLCLGAGSTLTLFSVCDSPSVTYNWSAYPPSFTSTLQNPIKTGIGVADTGTYQVIVETVFGCKDTASTYVYLVETPDPPTVTAISPYCQNDTFVPFTVTDVVPGATVYWYSTPAGTGGTTVPPVINTSIPGTYQFYFNQIIGSCESEIDTVTVVVNPNPAPITGITGVCQYMTITMGDATPGGTWSTSNPAIASIGSTTGVVTGNTPGTVVVYYTLPTTCRINTVVTVHPKPAPPVVPEVRYCQFKLADQLSVTTGGSGYTTTWYGLGVTPGMTSGSGMSGIVPNTDTAAGIYDYYVTQTSPFGCVSDSARFPVRIVAEPSMPVTKDTSYCQHTPNVPPLTAMGDSLRWYTSATSTPGSFSAPVPPVEVPGVTTWFVTQTQNACESQRNTISVEVLVLPDFRIQAERDWVCQYDSLVMNYDGPSYIDPAYTWSLPVGASFVNGTNYDGESVMVSFDTVWGRHDVILTVSNYNGRCSTSDTMPVRVIPAPDAHAYIKQDICLGDTITLALTNHTNNSHTYTWMLDGNPILSSPVVKLVTKNENTGGPYVLSWEEEGAHIITVKSFTAEGCTALPTSDTVKVHKLPNPLFDVIDIPDNYCIEDSLHFKAHVSDYNYSYLWEPEHSFVNQNMPEIWGRIEQLNGRISLTVTDQFGCHATYTKAFKPDECCTVSLPNAFTPNGDGLNDRFRPGFAGYRRFHIFRVSNRWGQTIFESANSNPSWDGTYNGVPQDMGTYFYYIRFDCGGKTVEQKGDITLIR